MTECSRCFVAMCCLLACTSRPMEGSYDSDEPMFPEDWIVGTFSSIPSGCVSVQSVVRFVVHEDGRFDILEDRWSSFTETNKVREWRAAWEQREPGSYRVMRVDEFAEDREYPIEEGYEIEVMRFDDCVEDAYSGGVLWQQIDIVDASSGSRNVPASPLWPHAIREGALCVDWDDPGPLMCPRHYAWFCEGTPLPPTCER